MSEPASRRSVRRLHRSAASAYSWRVVPADAGLLLWHRPDTSAARC